MNPKDAGPSPRNPGRSADGVGLSVGLALLVFCQGCATMRQGGTPLVPSRQVARVGPFEVHSNSPLPPDSRVVSDLLTLGKHVSETLDLSFRAESDPIEVYILDDRDAFEHFLRFYYPELPKRRAFFLAQGPRRVIYTYLGERLDEDLCHEATHALLHLAVGNVPLWLDEGLAEYFEHVENPGRHEEHLKRLPRDLEGGWRPNLAHLESIKTVNELSPRDYREAWAVVHFLIDGDPSRRTALRSYLASIQGSVDAPPLSRALEEDGLGEAATVYLRKLIDAPLVSRSPTTAAAPTPTVRLQDSRIDSSAVTKPATKPKQPKRNDWAARIRDFLRIGKPTMNRQPRGVKP